LVLTKGAPFVEDDEQIFLKTIIPSRKAKKELEDG
jgi:hypothetical protein